ncbi:hypothetical protein [Rhodovarius lipocyclicus]|uniref:hypothetical protein n=1 Tax=Rhodovarius lipocyclicus TaxID=268410 RepID=UPI00135AD7CC|nr:hypothetical protein [Rhodovarius lipocyclicus]
MSKDEIIEAMARAIREAPLRAFRAAAAAVDETAPLSDADLRNATATLSALTSTIPGGEAALMALVNGEATLVPARGGITPQMEVAAERNLEEQFKGSDWEDAKEVLEGLSLRAIYRAAVSATPYAAKEGRDA